MTDPNELLRRYLMQRDEMGEGPVVIDGVLQRRDEREMRERMEGEDRTRAEGQGGRGADREAGESKSVHPPAASPATPASGKGTEKGKASIPEIPPPGIIVQPAATDLFTEDELAAADLDQIACKVNACELCPLGASRNKAVPGEGPTDARLVVVGEGPGAREDETGRPFVGRAGDLLTDILKAIDIDRETVFICNIVKCRPPQNRTPRQEEVEACIPFLYRQLEIVKPAVILAMGGTAATTLLGVKQSLGSLRNRVHSFRGMPLLATYHPAALLRNPHWKRPTWDDVRIARRLLDE